MKLARPVFSAFVVSATLAVVPAQTSTEDAAVLPPAAVWPDWERPECATWSPSWHRQGELPEAGRLLGAGDPFHASRIGWRKMQPGSPQAFSYL